MSTRRRSSSETQSGTATSDGTGASDGRSGSTAKRQSPVEALAARDDADPVAAARALADGIRAAAEHIDRERRLPEDLVEEMRGAGLFHLVVPRSLGGLECDPVTANRAIEEVSAADGSAGWCVMIAAQTSIFAGFMREEEALEVWGAGRIACGTARPIGRAVPNSDPAPGHIVSGRWPFASGSSHADWFAGEALVHEPGSDEPRRDEQGNELSLVCFVPRSEVTVHDTWDTIGLRGTASNDFSVDGVFVPAGRSFLMLIDQPVHPWAVYRSLPLLAATHGSQALGVARAAVETAIELTRAKVGWGGVPLREVPRIQATIAEASVLVAAARTHLYASLADVWDAVQAGDPELARPHARLRAATSHAAQSSIRAVDLLHSALATSAIFKKSPLDRQFRDLHTAGAHVMIGPLTYEAAGRVELGMDAAFPFF